MPFLEMLINPEYWFSSSTLTFFISREKKCSNPQAVKREYIFLRMHPFNVAGSKLDNSTYQLDHVDGNGSCLFNVLSVLSVGSHVLSVQLRVRTCLEPVNHGPLYKRMDSQFLMIFGKFRQSTTGNVGICASQECFHLPGLCTQHPLWCSDR